MEGYVKFTCTPGEDGQIEGETKLSDVSIFDKIKLVDAVMRMLEMGKEEKALALMMSANGVFDRNIDMTSVDAGAIEKAKEARDEHSGDKT